MAGESVLFTNWTKLAVVVSVELAAAQLNILPKCIAEHFLLQLTQLATVVDVCDFRVRAGMNFKYRKLA